MFANGKTGGKPFSKPPSSVCRFDPSRAVHESSECATTPSARGRIADNSDAGKRLRAASMDRISKPMTSVDRRHRAWALQEVFCRAACNDGSLRTGNRRLLSPSCLPRQREARHAASPLSRRPHPPRHRRQDRQAPGRHRPPLAFAQSPKRVAQVVLRRRSIEGHTLVRVLINAPRYASTASFSARSCRFVHRRSVIRPPKQPASTPFAGPSACRW